MQTHACYAALLKKLKRPRDQSAETFVCGDRSRTDARGVKPPKAANNLGTDVDAPWGEKIEKYAMLV